MKVVVLGALSGALGTGITAAVGWLTQGLWLEPVTAWPPVVTIPVAVLLLGGVYVWGVIRTPASTGFGTAAQHGVAGLLMGLAIGTVAVPAHVRLSRTESALAEESSLLDAYAARELDRVGSMLDQHYTAVDRAMALYDGPNGLAADYRDGNYLYDRIAIDLFNLGPMGITFYRMTGRPSPTGAGSDYKLPLVSSQRLPIGRRTVERGYVRMRDYVNDEVIVPQFNSLIPRLDAYPYELVVENGFRAPFDIGRAFYHPWSQADRLNAFILFLDLISPPVGADITVNLFANEGLGLALLWYIDEATPETRMAMPAGSPIVAAQFPAVPLGIDAPADIACGVRFVIPREVANRRYVLTYHRGYTSMETLLGVPSTPDADLLAGDNPCNMRTVTGTP